MDVKYSLTKLICYIVSVLAIFSVFAIMLGWFESSSWISSIGFELRIAQTTIILAISAVLVPAIWNSINIIHKGVGIILILLSVLSTLGLWFIYSADFSFATLIALYIWGLICFTFCNLILPNKKLWPVIGLIFVCYLINYGFADSLIDPESTGLWAYRSGLPLTDLVSNSIDAGIRMVYLLLSLASLIMIVFGLKNQFQK
jgi:hypothetical protein